MYIGTSATTKIKEPQKYYKQPNSAPPLYLFKCLSFFSIFLFLGGYFLLFYMYCIPVYTV